MTDFPVTGATQAFVDALNANFAALDSSITSTRSATVTTIALLKALSDRPSIVVVKGYYAAGDGGGGVFWWDSGSTATANDGTIIQPTVNDGRYRRVYQGAVKAVWFGSGIDGSLDHSSKVSAALAVGAPVDFSGARHYVKSLTISSSTTCPGMFSDGTGIITEATGSTVSTIVFTITKSDFYVDKIFFDLAVSTVPEVPPPVDRAVYFAVNSTISRLTITNCRQNGGKNGFIIQGPNNYIRIANNLLTNIWSEAISSNAATYTEIVDNIMTDGGYGIQTNTGAAYGTVTNAGSGLTDGTRTFTVTSGRPVTATQFTATVVGGTITSGITVTVAGDYSNASPLAGDFPFTPTVTVDTGVVGGATFSLVPYAWASGAIRCNSSTQLAASDQTIVSRNIIARWNEPYSQEAIDITGAATRNLIVSDNNIADCGNGGIEIKDNSSINLPNVYRDILVSGNVIRMKAQRGTGIAMNISEQGVAAGKNARVKISDNIIVCDTPVTSGLGHYGVTLAAYSEIMVSNNFIRNVAVGISYGPAENSVASSMYNLSIIGNDISSIDNGIQDSSGASATLYGLKVMGNKIFSTNAKPLALNSCYTSDAVISGNNFTAPLSYGMEIRDLHDAVVVDNTILAGISGVLSQGTAVSGVVFARNNVSTRYPIAAASGSATLRGAGLTNGTRTFTVTSGTGTQTAKFTAVVVGGTINDYAVSGTVTNAGAGMTSGLRTFTVTNGTGTTATQFTAQVNNGAIVGGIKITVAGAYTVFPTVPTVTVDSGVVGGATFTLTSASITITRAGAYTVFPSAPTVSVDSGVVGGATFSLTSNPASPATASHAFNLSTGTSIEVYDNLITIPVDKLTVTGAGTYTASGNIRGMLSATPQGTYAGSVGDIFKNSSVSGDAIVGWVCTTSGNTSTTVWTQMGDVSTFVTKTANYSVTSGDYTVLCKTNAFTVTLPTAVGIGGQTVTIKNGNTVASGNNITLATTGGQTIDGLAPGTVAPLVSVTLVSDNANWWTV